MAESVALKGMSLEKKLEFMLDKAYEVLAEVGYTRLTLDMVAERVGVSKGTISYHFKNKEQLLVRSVEHISFVVLEEMRIHPNGEIDPKQRLLNFTESLWFSFWHNEKHPEIFKVYMDLWFHGIHNEALSVATNAVDEKFYDEVHELLSAVYEQRKQEGCAEIPSDKEIYAKVTLIVATVEGASKIVLSGPKDIDPGLLLEEIVRTVSKIVG